MSRELHKIESWRAFAGRQEVYRHQSVETGTNMVFAIFIPELAETKRVPVLWYLSGLTCTHENVMTKSYIQRACDRHGIIAVMPDTSPRGDNVPTSTDGSYDLGFGAGFYLDAMQQPWSDNYRMYSYVSKELPVLVKAKFPANMDRQGIMGHSMGGHGALIMALKKPRTYRSVSAFSPVVNPINAPWGRKAFSNYIGANEQLWREYDATALIEDGARIKEILIDQGDGDPFLERELCPTHLEKACFDAGIKLTLNYRQGYDHSYFFIATYMEQQVAWHSERLKG